MQKLLLKAQELQALWENKYKTVFVHKDGPVLLKQGLTFPNDKPTLGWFKLARNYNNPLGSLVKVR